ncbi:MAG: HAMP domain-containing histidine kinase [Anaerolineales bacterium]|nr:MAG: HAMP domain-containing histidine kinase [Anaerolineales bacterium]
MIVIAEALLTPASIRSEEVAAVPLDMAAIIGDIRGRVADLVVEHQAEITVTGEWPVAPGHAPWVKEMRGNCISNALRYGGGAEDGPAHCVDLGHEVLDETRIRFWVSDSGPGLTPE